MNVALIAENSKKELMIQFCIAYCGILAKHNIFATRTTGKMVADATGLNVHCLLPGTGGEEQISARCAYNEIDLVIMLRDPMNDYSLTRHHIEITTFLKELLQTVALIRVLHGHSSHVQCFMLRDGML